MCVYRAMARECDPVWRELHYGRIQAGDAVEDVLGRTRPRRVERVGDWVLLKYHPDGLCFTGVTVVAREEHLVGAYAWSCGWVREFFDIMSPEQRTEFFREHFDQPARLGDAIYIR